MNTIDLSFRPDTYWPESLTPEQLLTRIRGKERQNIARRVFKNHGFTGLNEFLVQGRVGRRRAIRLGSHRSLVSGR